MYILKKLKKVRWIKITLIKNKINYQNNNIILILFFTNFGKNTYYK